MTGQPLADIKWVYSLRALAPVEDLGGLAVGPLLGIARRKLDLEPGMRVLDLGCGSGRSLVALAEAVGPTGEVVGVDYTRAMLERARLRVEAAGLTNVRLIEGDAASIPFEPASFDRILASFVFSIIPRSRLALRAAADALRPGGRLVVIDLKRFSPPEKSWAPLFEQVVNPVYESLAFSLGLSQPGRELLRELERVLGNVTVEEHFGGGVYIASAERQLPADDMRV